MFTLEIPSLTSTCFFSCSQCDRRFSASAFLESHRRRHDELEEAAQSGRNDLDYSILDADNEPESEEVLALERMVAGYTDAAAASHNSGFSSSRMSQSDGWSGQQQHQQHQKQSDMRDSRYGRQASEPQFAATMSLLASPALSYPQYQRGTSVGFAKPSQDHTNMARRYRSATPSMHRSRTSYVHPIAADTSTYGVGPISSSSTANSFSTHLQLVNALSGNTSHHQQLASPAHNDLYDYGDPASQAVPYVFGGSTSRRLTQPSMSDFQSSSGLAPMPENSHTTQLDQSFPAYQFSLESDSRISQMLPPDSYSHNAAAYDQDSPAYDSNAFARHETLAA